MSFIRPGTESHWVDDAQTKGLYVYGDGERLVYMPTEEKEFVEVTMRMLEQSGRLGDDELESVFEAFAHRLNWQTEEPDLSRNITREDAYWDMLTAVSWMKEQEGWEGEAEIAEELREKLDPTSGKDTPDNSEGQNRLQQ